MKRCCQQARWLLVFLPILMSAGVLWAVDTPNSEPQSDVIALRDIGVFTTVTEADKAEKFRLLLNTQSIVPFKNEH